MKYLKLITLSLFFVSSVYATTITSIEIRGLKVISTGTVLNYLPVEIGDDYNTQDELISNRIIQTLYKTNFFKNIDLELVGSKLVISVEENPHIKSMDISGNNIIDDDTIGELLTRIDLVEGRVFSMIVFEKLVKQLEETYLAQGYYSTDIKSKVKVDDQHRAEVSITIDEGDVTKIKSMEIIGAKSYSEDYLLSVFSIGSPGLFNYFTERDHYSKLALDADIEKLKSLYIDNGFIDFKIENINTSLSADRKHIDISIQINEGSQYFVGELVFSGELGVVSEDTLKNSLNIETGDLFNRREIIKDINEIKAIFSNKGYAFSQVETLTNKQLDKKIIDISFDITLNRKIYINRIIIIGNTRTQDEVIRREIRQTEGGLYSYKDIQKSIKKLKQLGYFSDVTMETSKVEGSDDKIDLTFNVTETKTGNFTIGLSHSSNTGTSVNLGISERNFLGTGNTLNAQFANSDAVQNYNFFFTDPFFTEDNHSLSYGVFFKKLDADKLSVSDYQIDSYGVNGGYGIPLSDETRVKTSLQYAKNDLTCGTDFKSKEEVQCSSSDDKELLLSSSWSKNTLDNFYFPSKGQKNVLGIDIAIPGGDYRFYKTKVSHESYFPINKQVSFKLRGALSVADGYSGEDLPFFKRYYAGGSSSVRGFDFNSLGPKYSDGDSKGGELLTTGGAAVISPVPLVDDSKNMRISAFVDIGNVYEEVSEFESQDLRSSAGLAFSWFTPIGPIGFYFATPLAEKSGDETNKFEFTIGTTF